ncbi:MAG: peptidylprolyl isomerase [Clostridia bacterium]|nr:peptidylprolyl isomerase [Clostridia bacterium]
MKKQTLIALLIAAALILSGCSLNTVDKAADGKQVILKVGDRTLTKSDVASRVYSAQQYYAMYQQYGLVSEIPDAHELLDQVITSSTERFVLLNKAEQIDELKLTEEELAQVTETAEHEFDHLIEDVESAYITSGATGDALRQEAIAYAEAHGFGTMDTYLTSAKEDKLVEKITEYLHKDVTVTDEDLQAKLDELAAANKADYDADPTAYGTAVNNGTAVYYAPEGYRYVKHILIQFNEEDTAAVSAASEAMNTAKAAADSAAAALTEAQGALDAAAADADKTALQTAVDEAKAALDAANADAEAAAASYDSAKAAAAANIQAKADEVYALATKEGADFDALMAQYGEDPGMKRAPAMTKGYALCATSSYVPEFLAASLALEKVGDISAEVVTEYGIHIIKYEAEIPAGVVSLDSVRDSLTGTLTTEKENAAYAAALEEWTAASDIKSYPDKMGY